MSANLQFDLHPDAELLNGFVENEVSAAERTQILDHLATCSRCRQVVYLSLDAAQAQAESAQQSIEPVAPSSLPAPARERPRFRFWQFAWAGAGALACGIAIMVVVGVRQHSAPGQLAKLLPGPTPSSPTLSSSAPAAKQAPQVQPGKEIRSAEIGVPLANPHMRSEVSRAVRPQVSAAAPVPPPAPAAMDSIAEARADEKSDASKAPSLPVNGRAVTGLNRVRGPDVSQQNQAQNFASLQQTSPPPASAPAAGLSPSPGKVASQSASETVTVDTDALKAAPRSIHGAGYAPVPPGITAASAESKKSGLVMLPSGLPLVSTVEAGHTTLALDAVGSLYLSRDFGKKWEPVEPSWKGRATKVRLVQPENGANAIGGPLLKLQKDKAASGGTALTILFEIVNDKNDVWTSADGKTWSPK